MGQRFASEFACTRLDGPSYSCLTVERSGPSLPGTIRSMHRLSPRQVQTLGGLICGGDETPFEYRRFVDIEAFVTFTGAQYGDVDTSGLSRWNFACAVIEGAQAFDAEGASGLSREVEDH